MCRFAGASESGAHGRRRTSKGGLMWWGIGIGAGILYLVLMVTLGVMTIRNRHGWLFFFGIFFPILWIFGAFMSPPERVAQV